MIDLNLNNNTFMPHRVDAVIIPPVPVLVTCYNAFRSYCEASAVCVPGGYMQICCKETTPAVYLQMYLNPSFKTLKLKANYYSQPTHLS